MPVFHNRFSMHPYKLHSSCSQKTLGNELSYHNSQFNDFVKRPRVPFEDCIGILKNRFQFLKGIRMVLDEHPNSIRKILKHITTCIILHNFLCVHCPSDNKEFMDYDCDEFSDIDADNELNKPIELWQS